MSQQLIEFLAYSIFYSFFVILAIWGFLLLRARDRYWEEQAKLKAESQA